MAKKSKEPIFTWDDSFQVNLNAVYFLNRFFGKL